MITNIDIYSPIGNGLENINSNFQFLNTRLCNVSQDTARYDRLFTEIGLLTGGISDLHTRLGTNSSLWVDTATIVHNVSGYWLEPITLMYENTFNTLANYEEVENWLTDTFGSTTFNSKQILKVNYVVKNFDPDALDGYPLENVSVEVLDALAASYNKQTYDIQKFITYRNHVGAIISLINNILQIINRLDLTVNEVEDLDEIFGSFSIFRRRLSSSILTGVSDYYLKVIYSTLTQWNTIKDQYNILVDSGIPSIPSSVLLRFNTQNIYGTFIGSFCFLFNASTNKWEYIPDCSINFCVDDYCTDCYGYVDPNTLYDDNNCKLNARYVLSACFTNEIFVASYAQLENYLDVYADIDIDGTVNRYFVFEMPYNFVYPNSAVLFNSSFGDITFGSSQGCLACDELSANPSVFVIQICNSNSVTDDDFNIYFNGVNIGTALLGEDAQVGSVFVAGISGIRISTPDFVCPDDLMTYFYFNSALIQTGVNNISMENIQDNEHGNFGSIGVRTYKIVGNTLVCPTVIDDLNYSGDSGSSFEMDFNYP